MTELRHGAVTPEMLPLLTAGKSVLLHKTGVVLTLAGGVRNGQALLNNGTVNVTANWDDLTYIGERGPNGVISAPVGGWTCNPVPGRCIAWGARGIKGVFRGRSDGIDRWETVEWFSLIEDAKAEDEHKIITGLREVLAGDVSVHAKAEGEGSLYGEFTPITVRSYSMPKGVGAGVVQLPLDTVQRMVPPCELGCHPICWTSPNHTDADCCVVRRRALSASPQVPAVAGERKAPELLSDAERRALLTEAEELWSDLQADRLGGYSGINRQFWIVTRFKHVIEKFGRRDVGQNWSKNQLDALTTPTADRSGRDEEEAYEIGKRDGYESAVQDIDLATGGDGEYVFSTFPGEGCPDAEAMKARVLARFADQSGVIVALVGALEQARREIVFQLRGNEALAACNGSVIVIDAALAAHAASIGGGE